MISSVSWAQRKAPRRSSQQPRRQRRRRRRTQEKLLQIQAALESGGVFWPEVSDKDSDYSRVPVGWSDCEVSNLPRSVFSDGISAFLAWDEDSGHPSAASSLAAAAESLLLSQRRKGDDPKTVSPLLRWSSLLRLFGWKPSENHRSTSFHRILLRLCLRLRRNLPEEIPSPSSVAQTDDGSAEPPG